jgi:hypothetical protein
MSGKPHPELERIAKKFRERLDPVLTEPVPDDWLEPFVRQVYGHPDEEQEPRKPLS